MEERGGGIVRLTWWLGGERSSLVLLVEGGMSWVEMYKLELKCRRVWKLGRWGLLWRKTIKLKVEERRWRMWRMQRE